MCWLPPEYSVAVLAKRLNHLVWRLCQRPMSTENPGESSVVQWLSGIIPCLKLEKCTCGSASMKPRNSSGPKINRLETSQSRAGAVAETMDIRPRTDEHTADRSGRSLAQQGSVRKG